MLSTREAVHIIEEDSALLRIEEVSFQDAVGRVLRRPVAADRDLPPFNRVMMDGIAISCQAWIEGIRIFRINGVQGAGMDPLRLEDKNDCIEIMTGAVIAEGCDCVVPYEEVEIDNGRASVKSSFNPRPNLNVHQQGSDFIKGDNLIDSGVRLTSREIAVSTSCGKTSLLVTREPRLIIVSTGDELVEVDEEVQPFQIRRSNNYALEAALQGLGFHEIENLHIRDDPVLIEETLAAGLRRADVILLSGGISKGKFDYVPTVLENLGVRKRFHGVRQRPGKPFWYGQGKSGQKVFALPGNPLSTLICFHRYVVPALQRMLGIEQRKELWAVLAESFLVRAPMTVFLPVRVKSEENGILRAQPHPAKNSGDFASIVPTDGFVELPEEKGTQFSEGSSAEFFSWS